MLQLAEETLRELKKQQEINALPNYIQAAQPASEPATKRLQILNDRLAELQRKYFLIERKKKYLEFVTSRKAEMWMQKEAELVEKESSYQNCVQRMHHLSMHNESSRQKIVEMLSKLRAEQNKLGDGIEGVNRMKVEWSKLESEKKRLEEVEKVWEKKSPVEIEQTLEELQTQKTNEDQIVRQRTAIRDDKLESLKSVENELTDLNSTIEHLEQKAKEGRQSAQMRMAKRANIKKWNEKCAQLLSSAIGFTASIDKENYCVNAKMVSDDRDDEMDIRISLTPKDATIRDIWVSKTYPVDDLLNKAKEFDDFSWLLRQLHHRFVTFSARLEEINEMVEAGKNIIYSASQNPDTVLAVVNEAVFAFELSRKYPCSDNDSEVMKPLIRLVSAESARPEIVEKTREILNRRSVKLSHVINEICIMSSV